MYHDAEANAHATSTTHNGARPGSPAPTGSTSQPGNPIASYGRKLAQLFSIPRIRRATGAAIVCMLAQQMCGVNVLAFYGSTIFYSASNDPCAVGSDTRTDLTALWLSWGIGLSNFVFAFPAYKFIDSRGRRWLLLVTLPFLALSMLAAGLSFLIPISSAAHAPVIGIFIYVFMFFYSWGLGPVPFTISAEVQPLETRLVGMSFAVFVNLFGAGLLTLFVPSLTIAIGHPGLLGIFAGLNVVAFFLVFFFVRETAGAAVGGSSSGGMVSISLEELNYIFNMTTKKYIEYQLNVMVPWTWRHLGKLLLFQHVDPPEKCYNWAGASEEKQGPSVTVNEV
ncbi:hypothetical protein LTR85_008436 [Meristemomyces frigidus]|nr:hypothetical protein LTR85_008436 [Meristemomyces frigidus]